MADHAVSMADDVPAHLRRANIRVDRSGRYGNATVFSANLGLQWTGMLQQHYGITLDHPLPAELVLEMMAVLKLNRAASDPDKDNLDDAAVYVQLAEEARDAGRSSDQ